MAIKDPSPGKNVNGDVHRLGVDPEKILPGTTFPQTNGKLSSPDKEPHVSTKSQPGPTINDRPTTVTLHQSNYLEAAGQIPALYDLINDAFGTSQNATGMWPSTTLRLSTHKQLVQELSGKGTFTYVITYTGTSTILGTASAKLYKDTLERTPPSQEQPKSTFTRTGTSAPDTEGWELALMAVDPSLQRKGVAGLLIGLVEREVKRRFLLAKAQSEMPGRKLVMLLSTIKEVNFEFYTRRGYEFDYETFHEPGWLASPTGFTVVHMSKKVEA